MTPYSANSSQNFSSSRTPLVWMRTSRWHTSAQRRVQFGEDLPEPDRAGQQGLSAMQHDLYRAQAVLGRVFSDTSGRPRNRLIRHADRAAAPALVRALVHIAVVTGQVTPAVHLQHELIERNGRLLHSEL